MTDDLPLDAAQKIAAFLEAQAAELGASENTRLAYGRDLKDAAQWMSVNGPGLLEGARATIESYLGHLDDQGMSRATRARRLSALKQFYRFAFEEGWRADNPALQIKGPGRAARLPKTLSEADVDALLAAARCTGKKIDRLRNTCLMEILYATGLRVSELVSLPLASVRGDPRVLLIRGKGGKERLVPLSPPAREALADWLGHRDSSEVVKTLSGPQAAALFPTRSGSGHLTRHRFYALIKELAVAAGIDPSEVTPHTIRHAFATHLLARGADLRSIQTLLGHADVATTEIYTHILDAQLAELVQDHHPLVQDQPQDRAG
ncbi:MAG: tyrosine recombinase [Pseudomonadota bacterium]